MATLRRYPISCTLGLILGGLACHALAEPPAPAASNDNGLMTFPNVSVVNAPLDTSEQKPAARDSVATPGVRAYMDSNGKLSSEPTAAEAAQLSNAARPRTGIATAKTGVTAANAEPSEQQPQLVHGPDNSMSIMLTDDTMVFQVAHKNATGELTQQCVTGEDNAAHALHSPPVQAHAQEESHNDR